MARRSLVLSFALSLTLSLPSGASALTQPNGTPIPSQPGCGNNLPTGLAAVFACVCAQPGVCNIGGVCPDANSCPDGKKGTCETTLFHSFNDNSCIPSNHAGLDPWAEAKTTPETFHPTCGLTFTVVTRSDARFKNAFGWYNVTAHKPATADLHLMLDCSAPPGTQVTLDVRSHPDYQGGDIGFFLVTPESHTAKTTCASGDCCGSVARLANGEGYTYYSERKWNDDNTGPSAFIHLLVYDSHLQQRKFYFTWEDLYGGSNNTFTDLVTSVQGVECSGGGTACDTGKKGVCALGLSHCQMGALSCEALYTPEPERCDGLDNDCNGLTDDGASCDNGEVCQNGVCTPHCSTASEFACGELVCDPATNLCADPKCAGVTCPADTVCRGGTCQGPCDGIVCPHGNVCRLGACSDPCKHLGCAMGQVCALGLCVAGCNQCGGLVCGAPLTCDMSSGACTNPTCASACPDGSYCDSGSCKDACEGAKCPPGRVCSAGECVAPGSQVHGDGGSGGDGGSNGGGGGGGGCGCDDQRSRAPTGMAMLALLALARLGRRRRD